MKIIVLCIAALLAFTGCQANAKRAPDRIDGIMDMTTVDQCQIKTNLYIQGIRAFHLGVNIEDHAKKKQAGTLTARERMWMLAYMRIGWHKAKIVWGLNADNISKAWALQAGAEFNRFCVAGASHRAIEV